MMNAPKPKPPSRHLWGLGLLLLACYAAGLFSRPFIKDDRLYQLYARYVLDQPSNKQRPDENGMFDTVVQTNFADLVTVRTADDVADKRQRLTAFLWRHTLTPFGRLPDGVAEGAMLPFADIASVERVERLEIVMPLGVTSVAAVLKPKQPRSCVVLYQEGHRVSYLERKPLLRRLVDAGCEVVALSLPLTGGDNSRPLIDHPRFGRILLNDPDKLEVLETESFSTLQYFLTPPIVALNHVLAGRHFDRVGMIGFSGGGWVTTLVAALDPRILTSYSIAGTMPLGVHAAALSWGSYEQRLARLYDIANYPELYVMTASAPERRHVQYYNLDDPCCFSGQNWHAWRDAIRQSAERLGGKFQIRPYSLDRHAIGKAVANAVVTDFTNAPLAPSSAPIQTEGLPSGSAP